MTHVKMNNGLRKRPAFFDGFLGDDFFRPMFQEKHFSGTTPAVNVIETEAGFRIDLAAPGLEKGDFKLSLDKDILTIKVEKAENKEEDTDKYLRREYSYSTFERSFQLPKTIDNEKIEAKYENGVLNVALPKREEALEKPVREISIS